MSRLAPALAKRIDRLSWHAHAFHRFAHHPLCDRYAGELIALGRKQQVCRGCLSAALGLVIGTSVGICIPKDASTELVQLGIAAVLGLASLKLRLQKFAGRFVPVALACAATAAASRRFFEGDARALIIVALGITLAVCGFLAYRKRGPNRDACSTCPEQSRAGACSGLAPLVRREKAFQRLSQRWLDAARK